MLLCMIVLTEKNVKISTTYYFLDFSFFMSQDDAHYQNHLNAPVVLRSDSFGILYSRVKKFQCVPRVCVSWDMMVDSLWTHVYMSDGLKVPKSHNLKEPLEQFFHFSARPTH